MDKKLIEGSEKLKYELTKKERNKIISILREYNNFKNDDNVNSIINIFDNSSFKVDDILISKHYWSTSEGDIGKGDIYIITNIWDSVIWISSYSNKNILKVGKSMGSAKNEIYDNFCSLEKERKEKLERLNNV